MKKVRDQAGGKITDMSPVEMRSGTPDELAVFIAVIEAGGFAAAARRLGVVPSTASKIVARLEERFGVRLLERTTRSVRMSEAGRTLLPHARAVVDGIEMAHAEVAALGARPVGLVRISVGSAYAKYRLAPRLLAFQAAHSEVEIDLTVSDDLADPRSGDIDIAIRPTPADHVRAFSSDLHIVGVGNAFRFLCAAPSYVDRHGMPATPHELIDHDCLVMSNDAHFARWPFDIGGRLVELPVRGPVRADNADMLLDLALCGLGIVRLLDTLVGPGLANGTLVPILSGAHISDPVNYNAVVKRGREAVPRIRAVLDFLSLSNSEP